MTDTYKEKAERYADDLLDRFAGTLDDLEVIRTLLAIAWLEGTKRGAEETVAMFAADYPSLVMP